MLGKYEELAFKLMREKNLAFLATINADGTPQVTPVWIDTDGEHALINTVVGRVKYRNIKRKPDVSIAITEQSNPYSTVTINGKVVEEITGPIAEHHIHQLAKKYLGLEKNPWSKTKEQRVILKIKPDRISGMQ